jgi:DNA-binding MarR family transcriptional regulator
LSFGMETYRHDLGNDLLQLTLFCRKADRAIASSADLSVDELHCLVALHEGRGGRVKSLYERLGFSPTKMSKIFHSLEQRGYLNRTLQAADRRVEEVTLTDSGMKAAEDILSISDQVAKEAFLTLSRHGGPLFSYLARTES